LALPRPEAPAGNSVYLWHRDWMSLARCGSWCCAQGVVVTRFTLGSIQTSNNFFVGTIFEIRIYDVPLAAVNATKINNVTGTRHDAVWSSV